MKILICDDEELIRNVIKEYCVLEKYEVVEAKNGKEAILKMDKDIDLIIMDIMMPEMDGVETLKQLKAIKEFTIPVIALTADAIVGKKEEYLSAGFDDYLSKPIDSNELHKILKKYLQK